MKNNKKAIDILNSIHTDLPKSSYEENARTYKAVMSKVSTKQQPKAFVTAIAAALIFILSLCAVAAIVESSMDVSIPDKIAAWFSDDLSIKYAIDFTLMPKKISTVAQKEIKSVNDAGGKNFTCMQQLEKYLDLSFLESPAFKPPQYLDTDANINLIYTGPENEHMGFISASYQYKDYSKVSVICNMGFAVDKPQSSSHFYLEDKDRKGKSEITDYISEENGLSAKISESDNGVDLSIHFIYDDIAYSISVINSEGLDNKPLSRAIIDSFIVK